MRPSDIHPIVLAGGLGSRLQRVAPNTPKPMIRVCGRPFIEWVLRWLAGQGFESYFGNDVIPGMRIRCAREPSPLGTAGAVRHVTQQNGGIRPSGWLVVNGDSLAPCDLRELFDCVPNRGEGAIVGRWVESTARYGSLAVDSAGRLLRFNEKSAGTAGPGLINAGIYLFEDRLMQSMSDRTPLSLEIDVLPTWLSQQVPIAVTKTSAPFCDIGTEESLAVADEFIRAHVQPLFD
jgi:D-glycero-alpha-D-manno-heptose 1-phosphate guanylyltransferase